MGGGRTPRALMVKIVVLNVAVVVLILSVIEGTFRVSTIGDTFFLFSNPRMRLDDRAVVVSHPTRGFTLRSGYRDDLYRIDASGFREGGSSPAAPTGPRVLALGDSTTFGWGVAQGCDYPSQLGARIEALGGRPVRMLNGGVPSYSSAQVAITLEELIADGLRPDLVLISIMWNDIFYSSTPNWYPELLVFQEPPAWRRFLFRHSATFRYLAGLQIDRANRLDVPNPRALDYFAVNIGRMLDAGAHGGVSIVFVEPPFCASRITDQGMVGMGIRYTPGYVEHLVHQYSDALRGVAGTRRAPVIDHGVSLHHQPSSALFIDFIHPNREGYRVLADDLATALMDDNLGGR